MSQSDTTRTGCDAVPQLVIHSAMMRLNADSKLVVEAS
jgi:hypothetical protein